MGIRLMRDIRRRGQRKPFHERLGVVLPAGFLLAFIAIASLAYPNWDDLHESVPNPTPTATYMPEAGRAADPLKLTCYQALNPSTVTPWPTTTPPATPAATPAITKSRGETLFAVPASDHRTCAFVNRPSAHLWLLFSGAEFALFILVGIVVIGRTRDVARGISSGSGIGMAISSLVLAILFPAVVPFIVMHVVAPFKVLWPNPGYQWKTWSAVGVFTLLVAWPAAFILSVSTFKLSTFPVRPVPDGARWPPDWWDTQSALTYIERIKYLLRLRDNIQRVIVILGVVLAIVIATASQLRTAIVDLELTALKQDAAWKGISLTTNDTTNLKDAANDVLPEAFVMLYGAYFSMLLILAYVPAQASFQRAADDLKEEILAAKSVELKVWRSEREQLDKLLPTQIATRETFQTSIATLAPLLGSVFSWF